MYADNVIIQGTSQEILDCFTRTTQALSATQSFFSDEGCLYLHADFGQARLNYNLPQESIRILGYRFIYGPHANYYGLQPDEAYIIDIIKQIQPTMTSLSHYIGMKHLVSFIWPKITFSLEIMMLFGRGSPRIHQILDAKIIWLIQKITMTLKVPKHWLLYLGIGYNAWYNKTHIRWGRLHTSTLPSPIIGREHWLQGFPRIHMKGKNLIKFLWEKN